MKRDLGSVLLVTLTLTGSALASVVACSSDSEATPGSSGSPGDGGSSGDSGGPSTDGGVDSSAPRRTEKVGLVEIANQGSSWRAEAHIYEKYVSPYPSPCERHVVGNCEFEACLRDDVNPPPADNSTFVHAGSIEFKGARIPEGTTLTPESNGDYETKVGPEARIWQGGERLEIRATGNPSGIGAFDVTLTAPRGLQITTPAPEPGESVVVPRTADFDVAWEFDGMASGKVAVSVRRGGQSEAPEIQSVTCTFDPGPGKGKLPASMLSRLLPSTSATISFETFEEETKDMAGYEIRTRSSTYSGGGGIQLK